MTEQELQEEEASSRNLVPLFSEEIESAKSLEDNFHLLCKNGYDRRRTPSIDSNRKCYFLHHSDLYLKLGPFKVELQASLRINEMSQYTAVTFICACVDKNISLS